MLHPDLLVEVELEPKMKDVGIVTFTKGAGRIERKSILLRAAQDKVGVEITIARTVGDCNALIQDLETAKKFLEGKD